MPFNTFDKFDRPVQGGAAELVWPGSNAGNAYFGRVNITSDTNGPSAVVSTALVNSDSLVFVSLQCLAPNSSGGTFAVATISPGGFFRIAAVNSTTNIGSFVAMWEIKNPV